MRSSGEDEVEEVDEDEAEERQVLRNSGIEVQVSSERMREEGSVVLVLRELSSSTSML